MADVEKTFTAPSGSVCIALPYPDGDLANYVANGILAVEDDSPNLGRFRVTLSDATSTLWAVFIGANQPGSWDDYWEIIDLALVSVDTEAIADAVAALVTPSIGTEVDSAILAIDIPGLIEAKINLMDLPAAIALDVDALDIPGAVEDSAAGIAVAVVSGVESAVVAAVSGLDLNGIQVQAGITQEQLHQYLQANRIRVVLADTIHGGPNTEILEKNEDFLRAN